MKQTLLGLCVALATLGSVVAARATDLTGTWTITIERPKGTATSTCQLQQTGEKLTGTDSGLFGSNKVTGTIKGLVVVFRWENQTDDSKGPPPVIFEGKLESAKKMTGTIEVPYCPEGQKCKWTAMKQ
jgi:hypothetical protein